MPDSSASTVGSALAGPGEPRPQRHDVGARGGFVQAHPQQRGRDPAQVGARGHRAPGNGIAVGAGVHRHHVEAVRIEHLMAHADQTLGQDRRQARHAARDARQPGGPVVDGIHAGDDRQQHLRGADVGGGLFAPDVLLARLQRQPVGLVAVRVDAHADQATGHRTLELVLAGEVGRVRAAASHRHAEALRVADHDVGAGFARGLQQRQRQQVGRDDERRALGMRRVDERLQVVDHADGGRILRHHGEVVAALHQLRRIAHQHLAGRAARHASG